MLISRHTSVSVVPDTVAHHYTFPTEIELNYGVFTNSRSKQKFPLVTVIQEAETLFLTCNCQIKHEFLCEHQVIVLMAILKKEDRFTALLIKQHPYFEEQLTDPLHYFYLHKKRFLQEDWFLNVFEEWRNHGITILGFNELENNRLNPHKVKISIKVLSGTNWFNSNINARFGKTKATLKQVYRAVKNRTKYVHLDDGTLGILPDDRIEKFNNYFNSGEIEDDDNLRISKSNYALIEQLFDEQMLDENVKAEISNYQQKLDDFSAVKTVSVPEDFCGKLRPYQQQGLSWLNFLDDFNFGGCLTDDMGLGKSVQIIAFILSLRKKVKQNTNLLIVPTSLIFN